MLDASPCLCRADVHEMYRQQRTVKLIEDSIPPCQDTFVTVKAALDAGINFFDSAEMYG